MTRIAKVISTGLVLSALVLIIPALALPHSAIGKSTAAIGNSTGNSSSMPSSRSATFTAHVKSVSGSSFTIQLARVGAVTVNTNGSTTITKSGKPIGVSGLATGDRVTINGTLNPASKTINATRVSM